MPTDDQCPARLLRRAAPIAVPLRQRNIWRYDTGADPAMTRKDSTCRC